MSEDSDLNHLLNGLLEGSLSPAEAQRVRTVLRDSESARRDYYDLVAVELLLAEQYEMPDHIAMQAQLMGQDEFSRRESGSVLRPRFGEGGLRRLAWVGGSVAAVLAVSWSGFSFIHQRQGDISVVVSPDSHYEVNGQAAGSGILKAGDVIEVKNGAVSLALTQNVQATLEGPVVLKLGDRKGRVELISGSAYFSISQGGDGLEVHSPAGIIRDIGTRFGVTVSSTGEVDTHVEEGRIEIERSEGVKSTVLAGYSASWGKSGPVVSRKTSEYSYVRFLPDETPLLIDTFGDPDGTALVGRAPKIGQRWKAEAEVGNDARIRDGRFDTSGEDRRFSAGFQAPKTDGSVYMLTFRTRQPARASDNPDAEESISLRDEDGKTMFSLVARASRNHTWQLKDDESGRLSTGTRVSALEDHMLTVSFDRRRGVVSLFEGSSTQGTFIDELKLGTNKVPSSVCVTNSAGGDLSLDDIVVRMVTYQQ